MMRDHLTKSPVTGDNPFSFPAPHKVERLIKCISMLGASGE